LIVVWLASDELERLFVANPGIFGGDKKNWGHLSIRVVTIVGEI
jgi:hypothetical protein